MRQQRNADGDANAETGHRFGKGRDAVHDEQHGADAGTGPVTDPACQLGLGAGMLQYL